MFFQAVPTRRPVFGMAGLGLAPIHGEDILGRVGDGGSAGGGWSWAGDLSRIISAGGEAVERVAGAITGHQGQYTGTGANRYPAIRETERTSDRNPADLSLDRTASDLTRFISRNVLPIGLGIVGLMLYRSGR